MRGVLFAEEYESYWRVIRVSKEGVLISFSFCLNGKKTVERRQVHIASLTQCESNDGVSCHKAECLSMHFPSEARGFALQLIAE